MLALPHYMYICLFVRMPVYYIIIYIQLTHVIKERVNSLGTPFLESILNGGDGLVVVGSIKPYALEVLHLGITTSKT